MYASLSKRSRSLIPGCAVTKNLSPVGVSKEVRWKCSASMVFMCEEFLLGASCFRMSASEESVDASLR